MKKQIVSFFTKIGALITWSVIIFGLMLSGCATGRVEKPVIGVIGDNGSFFITNHEHLFPTWFTPESEPKLNYMTKSAPTSTQREIVFKIEEACRTYTKTVHPNKFVNGFLKLAVFAGTGYAGGLYGSRAITGANDDEYAKYGMWSMIFAALANEIVTHEGRVYTFENCGLQGASMFPKEEIRVIMKNPY